MRVFERLGSGAEEGVNLVVVWKIRSSAAVLALYVEEEGLDPTDVDWKKPTKGGRGQQ